MDRPSASSKFRHQANTLIDTWEWTRANFRRRTDRDGKTIIAIVETYVDLLKERLRSNCELAFGPPPMMLLEALHSRGVDATGRLARRTHGQLFIMFLDDEQQERDAVALHSMLTAYELDQDHRR
jgi:hypothetical protein